MATKDTPNPIFAIAASIAEKNHMGDDDGKAKKSIAASAPVKPKESNNFFL